MKQNHKLGFKFIRIYPAATNVKSRNYDPTPWLYEGAQIVALNSQHIDDDLIKYIYLFNNDTGYKDFRFNKTDISIKIEFDEIIFGNLFNEDIVIWYGI